MPTPDPIQQENTLNRYLLYFPRNMNVTPDVLSFTATEAFSQPYRYSIRFTCSDKNIPVEQVLNQKAKFLMRAPNPEKSKWVTNVSSWAPVRQVNGVITAFSRLNKSANEAVYECVLEHELALLDRNHRSAVYTNMTVPEMVEKLMKESGYFEGYNIDFDNLSRTYPQREMVIQWKETDLQFIRRLLAEVGIWFRFENHKKVTSEVVTLFGDSPGRYLYRDNKVPYVRNSGMTSHDDYVTDLEERYALVPESVLVRTYNYRDPLSHQATKSLHDIAIPDGITFGQAYHYADRYLTDGDFYGQEAETATFYARLRHEYLLNSQHVLGATTSDTSLQPGVLFHSEGNIPEGFKQGFLITTLEISGSRSERYRAILKGIPFRDSYSFRPEFLPRPVISGTVPARVVGRQRSKTYAGIDAQGRYHVKFDFDLNEQLPGFESAWVRLGRPYAGDTFGFHFPLLDGTEVAVAFEGGDPDRPFISHVLHDGYRTDLVNMRNDTRNVIRTASFNKIRLEDKRGQEHVKVSTEHGKSQISVGHLVDALGKRRGEGFEGRTDNWMALRAAKGIMLTTEPQPRAQGHQLDMTAAIAALESALSLATTLQQCAITAGVSAVDTAQQQQLNQALNQLKGAGLLSYASDGQAHITPGSLQLSAGKDLILTAGSDASVNVLKKFSLAVGEKLSLFARKLGIRMVAGAGDINVQAQRGAMNQLSQQNMTLTSTDGKVNVSAKQGIQLTCGGGGFRINANGLIEIFSPVAVDIKSTSFSYQDAESLKTQMPSFDKGTFKRRFRLHASDDPEQILTNRKFRLKNSAGDVLEGETDGDGCSALLDATDLETYRLEII